MGSRDYKLGYEFNAKTGSFQRAVGQMTSSLDKIKKQVNLLGFNAAFDIAGKIMNSTRAVAQFTMECVKLAAQAEGISQAFAKIGNEQYLNDLREATRGAVSDISLMKAAVQANNLKIPLEQLATFLEFAGDRALNTGEDFDFLVDSIVKGLGRKSVLILDNLGLSVAEINEEVAKTGDFFTGAANVIDREMKKAGVTLDTTTTKINRMEVSVNNLKLAWGNYLNQSSLVENLMKDLTTRFEMFANKDLSLWEKLNGSPNEYREWKRRKDEVEKFFPKLSNMTMKWQSPFSVPEKEVTTIESLKNEITQLKTSYEQLNIEDTKGLKIIKDKIDAKEKLLKTLTDEKKTQSDILKDLKENNKLSNSQGYETLGYGYKKEMPGFGNLKLNMPKHLNFTSPGLRPYKGMDEETIKAILDENKIAENMEMVQGLVGQLNNSFTNLFYNVGSGWKGMIDSMLNSFRMLVAQIASKAIIFAILNVLSGGTGGIAKGASGLISGGFKSFLGFAGGTNFAPGGMSLVGERGPELVNLPRGSQVIPNNRIGSSGDILITKLTGSQIDIILKRHYKGIAVAT